MKTRIRPTLDSHTQTRNLIPPPVSFTLSPTAIPTVSSSSGDLVSFYNSEAEKRLNKVTADYADKMDDFIPAKITPFGFYLRYPHHPRLETVSADPARAGLVEENRHVLCFEMQGI